MKTTFTSRILKASFVLAAMLFATSAFAAKGIIVIKPSSGGTGKTYSCTPDASGKFSFSNVEPGTYKLLWVLPEGTDPIKTGSCSITVGFTYAKRAAIDDNQTKDVTNVTSTLTTEMSPASGGSDPQGKQTGPRVSKSNVSNNRTSGGGSGKVSVSDLSITRDASSFTNDGGDLYTVLLEDIQITDPNPHGTVSAMAISSKGAPATKSTK